MKNLFLFLTLLVLSVSANAQDKTVVIDSTKITRLDEVLIESVRVKEDAPITHSNVTKEQLQKRNLGQDIPTLLNYLPSVVTTSDAGAGIGYSGIRVRGTDATRVNVTINGIPYNDPESQGTFWVNLGDFASSVESLQLQRGVGSSTNGSGAFGASLNILTDAVSEKASGEVSNSFGSYNTRKHTVKLSTGLLNDHFEISGRFSKLYSDGYIDRAFTDLKSYFLQGVYVDDNTLIKALTFGNEEQTYQSWYGVSEDQLKEDRTQNPYTYENETDNYWQNHYQLHWNQKLDNNWSTNIGLNYTKGEGYFEQYEDDTDEIALYNGIVVPTNGNTTTDVIRRRWLDNDFYVVNASLTYKNDKAELISGVSYNSYSGDHFGEVIWARQFSETGNIRDRYYEGDATKKDLSLFSKLSYDFNHKLTGFVDLQGRFVNYKTDGLNSDRNVFKTDANFDFFNPKVGLTYKYCDSNSFYVSYSRANREPNRDNFENNITTPETLNDFELGWRHKSDKLTFNSNLYYMLYDNQMVLSGALDDVGSPLSETVGTSYRFGLELDAVIKLADVFRIQSNLTLSSNKNEESIISRDGALVNLGKTNISYSPSVVGAYALIANPVKNLELALLGKYVGEQFMGNTDSDVSKLDSYFVKDFSVNYTIEPNKIFKSIVLTGLINNIFDTEYVSNGYYYTYDDTWSGPTTKTIEGAGYYPQATRNFLVGATLKF